MDILAIIKELRDERDLVERAIVSVEKMALQHGKRRGRPPAWVTLLAEETKGKRKRGRPPGRKRTGK